MDCNDFHETLLLMFLLTQVLFVCTICQYCQIFALWDTMNMLFVRSMDVVHAQYNVKHYVKHEILLLEMCLLYLYLPPDCCTWLYLNKNLIIYPLLFLVLENEVFITSLCFFRVYEYEVLLPSFCYSYLDYNHKVIYTT